MVMGMGIKEAFVGLLLIGGTGPLVMLAVVASPPKHVQHEQTELQRIPKPKVADSAWAYVLRCTKPLGVRIEKGGDLKDVKWFTTELPHDEHELLIGMWNKPDSIIIDRRFIERKTWVAHELLHHLLRGPPEEAHPYAPFSSPCHLMPWQNGVFVDGVLTLPDGTTVTPRYTSPLD